jgi:hypothetical protein
MTDRGKRSVRERIEMETPRRRIVRVFEVLTDTWAVVSGVSWPGYDLRVRGAVRRLVPREGAATSRSAHVRSTLALAFAFAMLVIGCMAPSAAGPSTAAGTVGSSGPATRGSPSPLAVEVSSSVGGGPPAATAVASVQSGGFASGGPASTTGLSSPPPRLPAPTPDGSGLVTITRADAGATIRLAVKQRVLVKLGTALEWTVTIGNEAVLARVPGITLVRGAQGLFEARKAGRATIYAVGDAACRKATPPCMVPSLLVTVRVVIK